MYKLGFYSDGRLNLTMPPAIAEELGGLTLVDYRNSGKPETSWAVFKRDPNGNKGHTPKRGGNTHRYEFVDAGRRGQDHVSGEAFVKDCYDDHNIVTFTMQPKVPQKKLSEILLA